MLPSSDESSTVSRRTPAWSVLLMVIGACTSAHERAELQALQGTRALEAGDYKTAIPLFEQSLQVEDREDAHLGLATALSKTGDGIKAVESLEHCESDACREKRKAMVEDLEGHLLGGFADDAGWKRFLRIEELAGVSKRCALVTAFAATDGEKEQARRKLVRAAMTTEVDRLAVLLSPIDPHAPKLIYAKKSGAELEHVTECREIEEADGRMADGLAEITAYAVKTGGRVDLPKDRIEDAFNWGLLAVRLGLYTNSPMPADPAAAMPLRSGADLTAFLNAMTAAGKTPECALFTAILRAEQLPRARRASLKGPLIAALAPLAPKNGETVAFKAGGRKLISMPSLASGAQSCQELDDLFAELSRGAAKMRAAMAAIGDDGSSGENSVALDRSAFIYGALRTRIEDPMSKADIKAADDDYAHYRRTHARAHVPAN